MGNNLLFLGILILLLSGSVAPAPSANSPAKIINGFISNHGSSLMKWLWSLKTPTKTAVSSRSMVRYENGYTVETVFDGSKLGVEPYSVEVLPNGELVILDSANSNIYKISSSLSLYSRPKLVTGSAEGYSGHVDGRFREARLNHPKGIAVDDRGNIYVADTLNNAIRKISDGGVTTIAGGKTGRGGSHVDGPSEDAKFSNDFDIAYVGSSCSLLVIDRGNRAIREIQLHFDDCAYQYGSGFPLGIAVLVAAGFFGYMLALLQRRVRSIMSSNYDQDVFETAIDQMPLKSVRPPLIPTEDDQEKQDESLFGSLGNLVSSTWASVMEIFGGILPGFRKKQTISFQHSATAATPWPVQESFVIRDEDEPPPVEPRNPTPRKTYAFMSKDAEKMHQLRQSRAFYSSWDAEFPQQQKQQQQQQHHRRHYSSVPHTYYEQSCEKNNEIVFGAVQEQDCKRNSTAKAVDSGDSMNNSQSLRYRAQWGNYPYM